MRSSIDCLIWLVSIVVPGNAVAQKGAILSRRAAVQRGNLLDNELRVFDAAKFVHIELESELHNAPVYGSCLVECDRIDDVATLRRAHAQFEVLVTDNTLFDDGEITAPHWLRKS